MKKTRNSMSYFYVKQIKLKLFGFLAVLMAIVLYSCSSEDESINQSGMSKTEIKSEKNKTIGNNIETDVPFSVVENLNIFSEQTFVSAESLEIALNKNSYIGFNQQAIQLLNSATNENELKIAFELAGIANSQEVIDILKNNVTIKQEFILENPNFYNLTIEKRTELLNASLELAEINYFFPVPLPSSGLEAGPDCVNGFNKARKRCQRDFGTCTLGALVSASAPPFWHGLIVEALCVVAKLNCDDDAEEDYNDCVIEEFIPGQLPPATGELTIHCTDMRSPVDSCWTTDSNGKYVGRVN